MTDLKIAIAGAGGRMGAANIRAVTATPGVIVHSAFERPGSPALGRDAGELAGIAPLGVIISDDVEAALAGADAIIDFTGPAVSVMLSELAAARGLVDIIGTTGCSREEDWAIQKAGSAGARIVKTGNFSLGVNLLAGLVRKVAAALPDYDVEILEMHHNKKVDAPSGTALMLGQRCSRGRGIAVRRKRRSIARGQTGPAPAQQHRLCGTARRQRHRRAHGVLCRRDRAHRDHPPRHRPRHVRRRRGARGALGRRPAAGLL